MNATAAPDDLQRVLVRYSGDLTTKARATRRRFEQRLARNLRDALGEDAARSQVIRGRDRIVVEMPAGTDASPLARVFGVQSISVALRRDWTSLEAQPAVTAISSNQVAARPDLLTLNPPLFSENFLQFLCDFVGCPLGRAFQRL